MKRLEKGRRGLLFCVFVLSAASLVQGCASDPYKHRLGLSGAIYNTAAFSPDGRLVASSVYGTNTVTIFDTVSGGVSRVLGHKDDDVRGMPNALAFSPDGSLIAVGGLDKGLVVWEAATAVRREGFDPAGGVRAVAFSPDGNILAAGGPGKNVSLFDVETGNMTGALLGFPSGIEWVAFSPTEPIMAVASGKEVQVWSIEEYRLLRKFTDEEVRPVFVAFGPDGKTLAAAGSSKAVVWRMADGGPIGASKDRGLSIAEIVVVTVVVLAALAGSGGGAGGGAAEHPFRYEPLAFSPDGQTILMVRPRSGFMGHFLRGVELRSLDLAGTRAAPTIKLGVEVYDVAWSRDASRLAVAGYGVRLFDTATGKEIKFPKEPAAPETGAAGQ